MILILFFVLKFLFISISLALLLPIKFNIVVALAISLIISLLQKNKILKKIDKLDNFKGRVYIFSFLKKNEVFGNKTLFLIAKKKFNSFLNKEKIKIFFLFFCDWTFDFILLLLLLFIFHLYQLDKNSEYTIEPKDCAIVEGKNLKINAKGNFIKSKLYIDDNLVKLAKSPMAFSVKNIKNSFDYKIVMDFPKGEIVKKFSVTVKKFPKINNDTILILFPRYTKIPSIKTTWKFFNYNIIKNSIVFFKLSVKNCDSSIFVFNKKKKLKYKNFENKLDTSILLKEKTVFKILAKNENGLILKDSIGPKFNVFYDKKPYITLLSPDSVTKIDNDEPQNIKIYAIDDFGLYSIVVKYYLKSGLSSSGTREKLDKDVYYVKNHKKNLYYDFRKKFYGRFPGDSIFYTIYASDYRGKYGKKISKIGEFCFYYPSFHDIYNKFNKENKKSEIFVKKNQNNNLKREIYRLEKSKEFNKQRAEDIKSNEQKRLNELGEIQKKLSKNIKKISKNIDFNELNKKLKKLDSLLNDGSIKKMQKLLSDSLKSKRQILNNLKKYKFSLDKELKKLDQIIKSLKLLKKDIKNGLLVKKMENFNKKLKLSISDSNMPNSKKIMKLQNEFKKIKNEIEKNDKQSNLLDSALNQLKNANKNIKDNKKFKAKKNIFKSSKKIDKFLEKKKQNDNSGNQINITGLWQMGAVIGNSWEKYMKTKKPRYFQSYTDYYNDLNLQLKKLYIQYPVLRSYIGDLSHKIDLILKKYNDQIMNYLYDNKIMILTNELTYRLYILENNKKSGKGSSNGKSKGKTQQQMMKELNEIAMQQAMINGMTVSLLKQLSNSMKKGNGKSGNVSGLKSQFKQLSNEQKKIQKKLQEMEGEADNNSLLKQKFKQLSDEAQKISNKLNSLEHRKIAKLQNDFLKNLKETVYGFKTRKKISKKRESVTSQKMFIKNGIRGLDFKIYDKNLIYENYLNYILRYSNEIDKKAYKDYFNEVLNDKKYFKIN